MKSLENCTFPASFVFSCDFFDRIRRKTAINNMKRKIFINNAARRKIRRRISLFRASLPPSFLSELEAVTRADVGRRNRTIVFASRTPPVLRALGVRDLPVQMFVDKLARGLFLSDEEVHGHSGSISKDIIRKVAESFADPAAVFRSATVKGAFVMLYDIDDLNHHLTMVSVEPNSRFNYYEVNLVSSIYAKKSELIYRKWIFDGLLLYYNEKKTRKLAVRLHLPSVASLSVLNVLTKSVVVKSFEEADKKDREANS